MPTKIAGAIPLAAMQDIGEGSIERRIGELIESRLRVYDYTERVGRVARARSVSIPTIDEGFVKIAHLYRDQLAVHFAAEFDQVEPTRAAELLDAVQVIVSFESFDFSRRRLCRSDAEIRRCWQTALTALLRP